MVVSYLELETFAERLLLAEGVEEWKARLVAHSLVTSNLRAVDSHGIQLLPFYLDQISRGNMNIGGEGRVVSELGAAVVYDGENAIGQVVAHRCCEHAVRVAGANGAAVVSARESNHFGAAAFWAQRMSAAGFLGIVMCNASPLVAPWQGRDPRVGTNPICMAVPGERVWLLDMATTTVAAGRIFKAGINNQPEIPAGWAMDSEGVPTTDTQTALKGLLMPLGGYKGSGLAMMVEILCSVLSGGAMSTQLGGIRIQGRPARVGQLFVAIDVSRFLPIMEFEARMKELAAMMKSSAPAKGYDEVLMAGEPEWRAEGIRRREGVPVTEGTWRSLVELADRHGIPVPVK